MTVVMAMATVAVAAVAVLLGGEVEGCGIGERVVCNSCRSVMASHMLGCARALVVAPS
jgi:hypothetical protein